MIKALQDARGNIESCQPPFWAKSGHLQTILGHLLPSPRIWEENQELTIPLDNSEDKIHATYVKGESKIIVYVFHGLGGSADAGYMQRTALVARSLGHHTFIINHRGCGKGAGLAEGTYHCGKADDLSAVIDYGRKFLPDHFHIAIGFSLSANALLLLCAKQRGTVLPDAAIAVNAPINLHRASVKLTEGLNKIYDKNFVMELKRYIQVNRPQDLKRVNSVKVLRDFDDAFTAPISGFKNREDYYETCSAKKHLKSIQIPTVVLTAENDPFVSSLDYEEADLSSCVVLHIEKCGGHMGYLAQSAKGYKRWLDETLKTYLQVMTVYQQK